MKTLRLALAQINVTVGDLEANADRILRAAREAAEAGADLVVTPELALCGYPPEDLLLKPHFIAACEKQLAQLMRDVPAGLTAVVGTPLAGPHRPYNSAVVVRDGERIATYHKMLLPNYGVFDEQRVLSAGSEPTVFEAEGVRIALHICEDSWFADAASSRGIRDSGVGLLLNLSSSPYHRAKYAEREKVLRAQAVSLGAHVAYCNLVGGQDELVFDGGSMVLSPDGILLARAPQFEEDLRYYDLGPDPDPRAVITPPLDDPAEVYGALRLGLHDYVAKNGFEKVVVAVSGGIDSALVAALAVDALGPDRVVGITMPSQYSSSETLGDAGALCRNLGIAMSTVPIRELYEAYDQALAAHWQGRGPDVTEENLQARIRGNIVMAFSNKLGFLVLTTGNKSELATGYCTLYGDMVGGFAVIKDVPKTLVFRLCAWRNQQAGHAPIPPSIIRRPPSAELRPDQKDSDSLPPYDILDPILELYVEGDRSAADIVKAGYDKDTVLRVIRLVDLNEYKRRQGAPGIKITPKAFGRDRRLPITNRYRETR
jgi:NAD+ synthase (glutamine-hydrolysing)